MSDYDEYDSQVPESYDQWANRMSAEYLKKRHSFSHPRCHYSDRPNQGRDKRSSSWTPADQERFEQQCHQEEMAKQSCLKREDEKCKRLQQKLQFVMKYSKMFHAENNNMIRLCDLPWISCGTSSEEILAVLLADVELTDNAAKKRCLRYEIIKNFMNTTIL